jgi:hypothetical protein
MTDKVFVAVWDDLGLESLLDYTEYRDQNNLLTVIAGNKGSRDPIINFQLRARYNSHRNYEIYAFSAASEIAEEDIKIMFENDVVTAKALIRSKGTKIGY